MIRMGGNDMKLHLLKGRAAEGYAQFGSMWEKGAVREASFKMLNENGIEIPLQSRAAAFWPDGSIKWAAHTADSAQMGASVEINSTRSTKDIYSTDNMPCTNNAQGLNGSQEANGSQDINWFQRIHCSQGLNQKQDAVCMEEKEGWHFCSRTMSLMIPKCGTSFLRSLSVLGKPRLTAASLKLILERRSTASGSCTQTQYDGEGLITEAAMEDSGPLMWSFCLRGIHRLSATGEECIPFVLRIKLYHDTERIDLQHTFLYDGDEKREFLKGIGIALRCPLSGDTFDRHVRFGTDFGSFHEAASLMLVWDHKHPGEIYERQISGKALADAESLSPEEIIRLRKTAENCPVWDRYQLCQDSDMHYAIRKKTAEPECCFLNGLHGKRAQGTMAFGGRNGSIMAGIRDFWQKYPSGLEVQGLSSVKASMEAESEENAMADIPADHVSSDTEAFLWIYTPSAEAYDYRHYDNRAYSETCYEGFPDFGATPYGIANTNDCSICFCPEMIPSEEVLAAFGSSVSNPPVYFGEPKYYHTLRAFGRWSLPATQTEAQRWLEKQLDLAVDFYGKEVENRHWYGIYDYGDVMHTYDCFRHVWRYDVGGYAWQNTELMPAMWLWLAFLRSGREDILRLAEAMSRHASDIDTYHLGSLKGLGSRHGVRHWGCPCKEIRIGMAAHYRFHYYLLCDRRMEDVFTDIKDADQSLLYMDPLRYVYDKNEQTLPTHARSGPDWSAMVSNWMTWWERTLDEAYLQKIRTGMTDISLAPLGLVSGPDFEYDPASGHLRYIGESATGGTHLQAALGGPQVWIELADLLEDDGWRQQIAQYGRFYYLSPEEKLLESHGLIGTRSFQYPIMAAAMAAYGAERLEDRALALQTIGYVFRAMILGDDTEGFTPSLRADSGSLHTLREIPWISTNFTAQWCLNVIMILDFVKEYIPETMAEIRQMLEDFPAEGLFRNC